MPRTTVNIDASVLRELKRLSRREGKSVGELISEFLAGTLKEIPRTEPAPFVWSAREMRAKFDLDDKDALYEVLDRG